jgi:hypothetical protein
MKNAPFFDSGRFAGSFVLFVLIAGTLDNFIGGHNFGILAGVIGTVALRLLWMWVEGSNVTITLWGQRCRLTVASLFVCAGAFLAVSLVFAGLAWLVTPSTKGVAGQQDAPWLECPGHVDTWHGECLQNLVDMGCPPPIADGSIPCLEGLRDKIARTGRKQEALAAIETRRAKERLNDIQHPQDRIEKHHPELGQTCTYVMSGANQRIQECHKP